MKVFKIEIAIIMILFSTFNLNGQTCCSGGTPLTGNLGIQGIEPDSWYFLLAYDYNFLNNLYSGTELLSDNQRERLTQTTLLQVIYPFSEKFSVNGLFSLVNQKRTIFSSTGTTNVTSAGGLGDVVFLLQYNFFSNLKRSLTLAAGPKLPVGKFDATDSELGLVLAPDLQPGTGSLDGIVGAAYSEYHLLNIPGFTFSGTFGYRKTTAARRFEGDDKYTFGNEMMFSAGFQKNFLLGRTAIIPFAFLRYRQTTPDRIEQFEVAGTGGDWFFLNPGFIFEPSNNWSLTVSGELPVYQNLQGTQLTTTYRLNIGLAIKLFKN